MGVNHHRYWRFGFRRVLKRSLARGSFQRAQRLERFVMEHEMTQLTRRDVNNSAIRVCNQDNIGPAEIEHELSEKLIFISL